MDDRGSGRPGRCAIAIMAKAPRAGRVKTRLSPVLSPHEATELQICFLRDIAANLAHAALAAPIDPHVAFAPAGNEAAFKTIVPPGTGFVLADGSMGPPPGIAGFGICLLQATSALFEAGYAAVALLNSDSPTLPTARLVECVGHLLTDDGLPRHGRVVIGPSLDGGYYLLGSTRPHPELFQAIDWSTERVAEQTRRQARGLGLDVIELAPWYDVDDPPSLGRLSAELASPDAQQAACAYPARATGAFLEQHAIADRLVACEAAGSGAWSGQAGSGSPTRTGANIGSCSAFASERSSE
jgi:rSAM/selenodomain-associated transferase 1